MTSPENSYWSIEACAWVRHPRAEAEVPEQRPAEAADPAQQAEQASDLDADLPSGVPV